MSNVLNLPAKPRRISSIPAWALWPNDVVILDGRTRQLTRVEVSSDRTVVLFAGDDRLPMPAGQVVQAVNWTGVLDMQAAALLGSNGANRTPQGALL